MGKVNIIIAAYNKWDSTQKAIESVFRNSPKCSYKFIFVNSASTDETHEEICKTYNNFDNFLYIKSDENGGCGIARNIGLREIDEDCEYIILLDNDVIVTKNWCDNMIDFMEKHQEIGICGPCSNFAGSPQLIENVPEFNTVDDIENFAKNYKHKIEFTYVPPKWPVIGFCFLIRRETFNNVGLFDENYKFYGYEDTDYCYRAEKLGWRLSYYYKTFIYHKGHGSLDALASNGINWVKFCEENKEYFKEKHGWI